MRLWAIIVAILTASLAEAAEIRLRPDPRATGVILKLADVAEILTNDESLRSDIAKIELGPAPEPGESVWIDINDIKDRLRGLGPLAEEIDVVGPRRTEIRQGGAPAITTATRRSKGDWRNAIIERIRSQFTLDNTDVAMTNGRLQEITIRVEGEQALDHLERFSDTRWNVQGPELWREGWQVVELIADIDGESLRFPLRVLLVGTRSVVAPRVPIEKGSEIADADLMLVVYESTGEPKDLARSAEDVIGMEAKRSLPAGEPIRVADLRRPPVVFRGQPINVQIRYRTAWIQKTFLASADAGVGEWIDVTDVGNQAGRTHDYQVRVTGPHSADLPLDAPPSRSALRATSRPRPTTTRRVP